MQVTSWLLQERGFATEAEVLKDDLQMVGLCHVTTLVPYGMTFVAYSDKVLSVLVLHDTYSMIRSNLLLWGFAVGLITAPMQTSFRPGGPALALSPLPIF